MRLSLVLLVVLCFSVLIQARRLLPDNHVFNQDISGLLPKNTSDAVMAFLATQNGGAWPNDFQADNSFLLLHADATTPFVNIGSTSYGDCDNFKPPSGFPLPAGGGIEGTAPPSYSCDTAEDCHLLVVDKANGFFYEAYKANVVSNQLETVCALQYCMSYDYPGFLGDQCTSADAAGYAISPLLFTVDEISDGVIDHALRMTLPNEWFGEGYVAPATHGTKTTSYVVHSTDPDAPFYGYRFRLKNSFSDNTLPSAAQIIITALKKYGIYLADGGNFALMMANDAISETGMLYSDFGLGTQTLKFKLTVSDFEVVQSDGPVQPVTQNCNPLPPPSSCSGGGSA